MDFTNYYNESVHVGMAAAFFFGLILCCAFVFGALDFRQGYGSFFGLNKSQARRRFFLKVVPTGLLGVACFTILLLPFLFVAFQKLYTLFFLLNPITPL